MKGDLAIAARMVATIAFTRIVKGRDEAAIVDANFAVLEGEQKPVLSMRQEGINIVAIHQQRSTEQPSYVFLHYCGKGTAVELAHCLKRLLNAQTAAKSSVMSRAC